jgi:hypothetical protein
MASDCRYGASEESRYERRGPRKENAARTAPRYLCVAHSWKVFSGMLHRIPRSGLATSIVTVAWPSTLELVPFIRGELQLPAWYQVRSTFPSGLFGRMLQSYPPRDEGRGFDASGTGSPHHTPH